MSLQNFLIPLTNVPQEFQITLGLTNYVFTTKYNNALEGGWVLDIADANTSESIISNIPFVTGCDLLAGLEYLGIEGSLFIYTDGDPDSVPTFDNLGVESNLYYQTDVA